MLVLSLSAGRRLVINIYPGAHLPLIPGNVTRRLVVNTQPGAHLSPASILPCSPPQSSTPHASECPFQHIPPWTAQYCGPTSNAKCHEGQADCQHWRCGQEKGTGSRPEHIVSLKRHLTAWSKRWVLGRSWRGGGIGRE